MFREAIVIRNATGADWPKVSRFYAHNRHTNLRDRGDEELLRTIHHERRLLVALNWQDEIVAASATFGMLGGRFRELGATRVIKNGFGLQKVLLCLRALHEEIEDPSYEEQYTVVSEENHASLRSVEAMGFVPWNAPEDLVAKRAAKSRAGDLPTRRVRYLRLPKHRLPIMAEQLLKCVDTDECPKLGADGRPIASIVLDVRAEVIAYHRPIVEAITRNPLKAASA